MYKTASELWKQYCAKYSAEWVGDDPRHDLSAEVRERLTQLDLVLEHLSRAVALVAVDPERTKRDAEWFRKAQPRLARGEITEEEFAAGLSRTSRTPEESRGYVHAWNEVRCLRRSFISWLGVCGRFSTIGSLRHSAICGGSRREAFVMFEIS